MDNELDTCLSKYSQKFYVNRTIEELRECWFQMRNEGKLNDQQNQTQTIQGRQTNHFFFFKYLLFLIEHTTASKLNTLLAPFEFELLSRKLGNKELFTDKTDLPHALLHVNDRLFCMYTDQV